MNVCDECRSDFDAMSRLVESLPDDMKTSDCVSNAKMLLVALAYQKAEKENAKLRELVKSMYYDLTNMTFPPDWVTDYAADLRELRIEVDE